MLSTCCWALPMRTSDIVTIAASSAITRPKAIHSRTPILRLEIFIVHAPVKVKAARTEMPRRAAASAGAGVVDCWAAYRQAGRRLEGNWRGIGQLFWVERW